MLKVLQCPDAISSQQVAVVITRSHVRTLGTQARATGADSSRRHRLDRSRRCAAPSAGTPPGSSQQGPGRGRCSRPPRPETYAVNPASDAPVAQYWFRPSSRALAIATEGIRCRSLKRPLAIDLRAGTRETRNTPRAHLGCDAVATPRAPKPLGSHVRIEAIVRMPQVAAAFPGRVALEADLRAPIRYLGIGAAPISPTAAASVAGRVRSPPALRSSVGSCRKTHAAT